MARGGIFLQICSSEGEREKEESRKRSKQFLLFVVPRGEMTVLKWSDDKCLIWSLIQWRGGGGAFHLRGDKTGNALRMQRFGKFRCFKSLLLGVQKDFVWTNEWMNEWGIFSGWASSCHKTNKQKHIPKVEIHFSNMSKMYSRLHPSKSLVLLCLLL